MSIKKEGASSVRGPLQVPAERRGGAIEPWFALLLLSLVPLMGALFVPSPWRMTLHAIGGILCAVGLVLLIRHEMTVRRNGM